MRTIFKAIVLLLILILVGACNPQKRKLDLPNLMLTTDFLIPHPISLIATNGSFPLDRYTAISTSSDEGFEDVGHFLAEKIKTVTNLNLKVNPTEEKDIETIIRIQYKDDFETDNLEAYELIIGGTSGELSEEDQEKMFNRFYRTDPSRDRNTGGSGLGLSIVKDIVDFHDGELQIINFGKYNQFVVKLPK